MRNKNINFFKIPFMVLLIFIELALAELNPKNLIQYNEEQGLPASQVYALLSDSFGYMWIGTMNGLARYDGYEFKKYANDPTDSLTINMPIVYTLYEDSKRNIWMGAHEGIDVYRRTSKSFIHINRPWLINDSLGGRTWVSSITEIAGGRFLIGYNGQNELAGGLLVYDSTTGEFTRPQFIEKLDLTNVWWMRKSKDGTVWINGYRGLYRINLEKNIAQKIASEEIEPFRYFHTAIDSNGLLWAPANNSSLLSFDPITEEIKTYPYPPNGSANNVYSGMSRITIDRENNVWLASDNGMVLFDVNKQSFSAFPQENELAHNGGVYQLEPDNVGSIWVGTEFHGIFKYTHQNLFESFSYDSNNDRSISDGWVSRIIEDDRGDIWLTSTNALKTHGISRYHPDTKLFDRYRPNDFGLDLELVSIFQNSHNEYYVGTFIGVFAFSPQNNSFEKKDFKGVDPNITVWEFHRDRFGNLWLATTKGLYCRKDGMDAFEKYDLLNYGGISQSNDITQLFESKYHGLWLITNGGLFLYDYETDTIKKHEWLQYTEGFVPFRDVNSFYEDRDGIAWIGTWRGGLSRYDVKTGEVKIYNLKHGLSSNAIQGILGDDENNTIWLSTFEGISRFDKLTEKFSNFSIQDGIKSPQFADGSYLKSSTGLLYFGGSKGLTVFDPKTISKNIVPPKLLITDFKLSNESLFPGKNSVLQKPIYETRNIELSHHQNDIAFEFVALHFANPSENKYAYFLENYEDEWRYVGNQRQAIYPNLPPGDYTFRLKASSNNDVWTENDVSIRIKINPPWWNTWIAYIIYLLLGFGVLWAIRKYELERRKEKEKKRILEAENNRKSEELERARQLQLSMLPKKVPDLPNLEIAAYMNPATEVGGDYYDFHLSSDGTLTVAVGDATGHGMQAGMMVTATKSLFESQGGKLDTVDFMNEANRTIKQMHLETLKMAFTLLKMQENKLYASGAGMPPILIYRDSTKKLEDLTFEGMPLGSLADFPYEEKRVDLSPGDKIVIMSDGFPERLNTSGEMLDYPAAYQVILDSADKSPQEMVEDLVQKGDDWAEGRPQDDDVTFVVIKVK